MSQSMPAMGAMCHVEIGGGLGPKDPTMPPHLVNYLFVADLAASTAKVVEHGGKLVRERTVAGKAGAYVLVEDPDGNLFGLWQSNPAG